MNSSYMSFQVVHTSAVLPTNITLEKNSSFYLFSPSTKLNITVGPTNLIKFKNAFMMIRKLNIILEKENRLLNCHKIVFQSSWKSFWQVKKSFWQVKSLSGKLQSLSGKFKLFSEKAKDFLASKRNILKFFNLHLSVNMQLFTIE